MKKFESFFINTNSVESDFNNPCFVIAEVAQAHDGSLGIAHSFIDAVAEAGADAIKFQTHIADSESTIEEQFRVDIFPQDESRYAYWKRMEFTFEQWDGLFKHAQEKGLVFLSSPFSIKAVDLLSRIGVEGWKIGSGEFFSDNLIDKILHTEKPLLISTGMSLEREIDIIVGKLLKSHAGFGLLQCTSKYPTNFSEIGLNVMHEYKEKYDCPIGLSDHSGSIFPGLASMAQGCNFLEVHVAFDKRMFGPDASSSIQINELKFLCQARDAFHVLNNSSVDKDETSKALKETKELFSKSLSLKSNLKAGDILTKDVLAYKKPANGIPIKQEENIIGKKLVRDVNYNELLKWEDLI